MDLAVTTVLAPSPAEEHAAREAGVLHRLPFVSRRGRGLTAVAAAAGTPALLVLGERRASIWLDGAEHAWDPGMGALRMKRLAAGERSTRDGFLEASGLRPGDEVFDGTLGLGADALVAAAAVGPRGRVLAVESSAGLAALVAEGLRRLPGEAPRRIEVRRGDARATLASLPDRCFDVVAFDPMFRSPRREPPGFDLVRRLGDARPLSPETLAEARRVARRTVVVKDGSPGWDLARLGIVPLPGSRGAHRLYARVDPLAPGCAGPPR